VSDRPVRLTRHADHDPSLICRPALGYGLCEVMETPVERFYLLACFLCGDPERPLPMPFGSPAERGKWASGHTRATGHERWHVWEEVRVAVPSETAATREAE
jgi:hypothetical protein